MGLSLAEWQQFCRDKRLSVDDGSRLAAEQGLAAPNLPVKGPLGPETTITANETVLEPFTPISFWVDGIPKGQPRPRAFSRGGKAGVYDPGTANEWKNRIAEAAKPWSQLQLGCPLSVTMRFILPRPQSHFLRGVLRVNAPHWMTGKPDLDNAIKSVLDILTQVGIWKDDAQVARIVTEKAYGRNPGAHIIVEACAVLPPV